MNPNLEELFIQAALKANELEPNDHLAGRILQAKIYGELIVQECANQCDLLLNHKMSTEWARGTHDCSKAIREYFGVE